MRSKTGKSRQLRNKTTVDLRHLFFRSVVFLLFLAFHLPASAQQPVELTVLASNLSRPAVSELIPKFEKTHNVKVRVQYANNPIIKEQIEAGAKFDVVILEPQMLEELSTAGWVNKASIVNLAKVGLALVSKEGAPAIDIGTVESFKKILLSSKSIAYTADGHSGAVFLRTLEKIGISNEMKPKLVPVVGRFSTLAVTEGTAQYTAFPPVALGPGLQIAGRFPEEIQTYIGVSAAAASRTVVHASVRSFLEYLQSDSSMAMFKAMGFTTFATAPVSVAVEKEPMHRLKFENEFVRVFDVLIPVGNTSQYHTHIHDGVSVRVSNTQILDEVVGGEKTPFAIKYGDTTFGARPAALTHRVINSGKSDFRNIFIEILPVGNATVSTALPILSDGHVIVIDNTRVRVNRLTLKPGESSKLHKHTMRGLGIVLYDSKIEIVSADGTPRTLEPKAGDFVWQDAGTTHIIRNIGSTVFEAIDLELKHGMKPTMSEFASNYARAWSSKDPENVAKFFSESGWLKVNSGKPAVGRAAITEVARGFMTAFPDMVVTMDKIVEKGDVTEFRWTLTGTNTGPGGKGKKVKISGREEWRIGPDGLIAESDGHFDEADYNRQIEGGVE